MAEIVGILLNRDAEFRSMAGAAPLRAILPDYDRYIDEIDHKSIAAQCVTTTDDYYTRKESPNGVQRAIDDLTSLIYNNLPEQARQHVVVCGGAVFEATRGRAVDYSHNQDIDLFLYNLPNERVAAQFVQELVHTYTQLFEDDTMIIHSCSAITLVRPGHFKIQIILRLYKSISHIIHGFDITAAALALLPDRTVVGTELALLAFRSTLCIIDPTRRSATFGKRIAKYGKRNLLMVWPHLNEISTAKVFAFASYRGSQQNHGSIALPGMRLSLRQRTGDRSYIGTVYNQGGLNTNITIPCPDYDTTEVTRNAQFPVFTAVEVDAIAGSVQFRTESPDAQWTSSFDPIMTTPQDFYGAHFRSLEAAQPIGQQIPYKWAELPVPANVDEWYTMEAVRSNPTHLNHEGVGTFANDFGYDAKHDQPVEAEYFVITFMVALILRGQPIADSEVLNAVKNIPNWNADMVEGIKKVLTKGNIRLTSLVRYPAIKDALKTSIMSMITDINSKIVRPLPAGKRSMDQDEDEGQSRRRRRFE